MLDSEKLLNYFKEILIYSRYDIIDPKSSISVPIGEIFDGQIKDRNTISELNSLLRNNNDTADLFEDEKKESNTRLCIILMKFLSPNLTNLLENKEIHNPYISIFYTFAQIDTNGRIIPPNRNVDFPAWVPYIYFAIKNGQICSSDLSPMNRIINEWALLSKTNNLPKYWNQYWEKLIEWYKWITEDDFESTTLKTSNEELTFIDNMALIIPGSDIASPYMTNNILSTYISLESSDYIKTHLNSPLSKLLLASAKPTEKERLSKFIANDERIKGRIGFLGRDELGDSQKAALYAAKEMQDGDILTISGPPGTGKTTYIEAFIADYLASSVLKGEKEAPFIIVCSNNNKAVTNVIEKIAKDYESIPFSDRWIAGVSQITARIYSVDSKVHQRIKRKYDFPRNKAIWDGYIQNIVNVDKDKAEEKKNDFLKKASAAFNEKINFANGKKIEFTTPQEVQEKVKKLILLLKEKIDRNPEDLNLKREILCWAIHYYECSFIILLLDYASKLAPTPDSTVYSKYFVDNKTWQTEAALKMIRNLTPVICSTFHSLSYTFTYYDVVERKKKYIFEAADYLIIDEAGQVSPEIAVPTFAFAKKAIILGDEKQLEPIWHIEEDVDRIKQEDHDLLDGDSINSIYNCTSSSLIRMAEQVSCKKIYITDENEKFNGIMLLEHYRCFDRIINFCNENYYDNHIIPLKDKVLNSRKILAPELRILKVEATRCSEGNISKINMKEVDAIIKWLKDNIDEILDFYSIERKDPDYNKKASDLIGIITPFVEQAHMIQKKVKESSNLPISDSDIGTVHSFQGGTKKIILFSSVYGSKENPSFINAKGNMINVAVSRAADLFILVTSQELNIEEEEKNSTEMNKLITYIKKEKDYELPPELIPPPSLDGLTEKFGIKYSIDFEYY